MFGRRPRLKSHRGSRLGKENFIQVKDFQSSTGMAKGINVVEHLGRLLRWAQRSQLCPSESKQGLAWSCPPGSRTARWWPLTNILFNLFFSFYFTSTAGFCPSRKASSRSTGPGGLAAAGSSHSKSEAASNLHLGARFLSVFFLFST